MARQCIELPPESIAWIPPPLLSLMRTAWRQASRDASTCQASLINIYRVSPHRIVSDMAWRSDDYPYLYLRGATGKCETPQGSGSVRPLGNARWAIGKCQHPAAARLANLPGQTGVMTPGCTS